eukprot:CAMPEP_0114312642 /NCGR_PEP_ID=MMETSP0059-20121206/20579_1 /TAXON_ID=36894 /ORGANISM="Pyramimonas parkeae, Strain CCMP726" /LENGTH=102 /DNA_ID=CAMNT_0001437121 /DNA_START=246 /DNA_END=554 /DNA_ORIENTATION=-
MSSCASRAATSAVSAEIEISPACTVVFGSAGAGSISNVSLRTAASSSLRKTAKSSGVNETPLPGCKLWSREGLGSRPGPARQETPSSLRVYPGAIGRRNCAV